MMPMSVLCGGLDHCWVFQMFSFVLLPALATFFSTSAMITWWCSEGATGRTEGIAVYWLRSCICHGCATIAWTCQSACMATPSSSIFEEVLTSNIVFGELDSFVCSGSSAFHPLNITACVGAALLWWLLKLRQWKFCEIQFYNTGTEQHWHDLNPIRGRVCTMHSVILSQRLALN